MATLTGRTIKSTYDQLLQLEDTLIQDGFGTHSLSGSYNLTGSQFISGNLHINGTASIDYIVSSYESSSIIYSSGSTKFGDTLDDTHEFTGSVTITGSANSEYWSGSFSGSFQGLIDSASNAERAVSASQADNATTSSIADKSTNLSLNVEDSSAATHYVIFGANTTGETGPKTDSALNYTPNTETLAVTKVIGQLEGSASYASTASVLLGAVISSSHSETASLAISTSVINVTSASFADTADTASVATRANGLAPTVTASFADSATSASHVITSSMADRATTASFADLAGTIRSGLTASHADRATSASISDLSSTLSATATASFANISTLSRGGSGSFSGSFQGDGSSLTGIAGYTVANSANNRVITSVDATNGNAEANLSFDGTTLTIVGNINTGQGATEIYLMNQDVRTTDDVTFGVVSASAFTETSTIRSKENIESLDNSDIIYKLRPVSFDWKNTGKHDIGLIAEETIEHLPEIVQVGADGQAEGIRYSKLTPLLIKAIQDQQKQIVDLTAELNWVKNRL
jgi:hypothetical protein